jgi:hypothetical protein
MAVAVPPYQTYPTIPTGVITRQPGSKLKTSREGVSVLTETYIGNFADLIGSPLTIAGSNHPEFPTLLIWSNDITEGKAGIGTLEVESRGIIGGLPDPIYALERATHNEPISTHPLWATQIAGTPANPMNGAIFVDPISGAVSSSTNAVFKGWTTGSIFEGIEDYLLAGSTWTETYVDYNPPDLDGVGQISSPEGPAPDAPNGCVWIFTGGSCSEQGSIYRVQKTWLLTGGYNTQATSILYGGGS